MNLNAASFKSLEKSKRDEFIRTVEANSEEDAVEFLHDWSFWSRENQVAPPGNWFVWLILAGRGFGKTRSGAEWVRARVESGLYSHIALVGDTAADVRDVMIEGPSGIMAVSDPRSKPSYEPSKRRLTWGNGATATAYAAEAPESLRGPQHDTAWCDEPAKWKNLRKRDLEGGTAWDNLLMGLRVGDNPQCACTTTPRSIPWLTTLLSRPSTVTTRGSSYENRDNLSPKWFEEVIKPYEGTRLGRQEIDAELIGDVEGSMWKRNILERQRIDKAPVELVRILIALDPSVSSTEKSDECGMVVAGKGTDGNAYVLDDISERLSPHLWASKAIKARYQYSADLIVGEVNNGGDLIELTLRTVDQSVPYKKVHASRGKLTRAEPVAALYEKGVVCHVGSFPLLEDEMCSWQPGEPSPNRMDALVWAITELMIGSEFSVLFEA